MRTVIKGLRNGQRHNPAGLTGIVSVPGDKSISHRAVMLGAISEGVMEIEHFLSGEDCLATIHCFRALGVDITINGTQVTVRGQGLHGLRKPAQALDVGNSGTTLRLMSGLLAGQAFESRLTGDASIQKRPMNRVIIPLSQMGAQVEGTPVPGGTGVAAPITVKGGKLNGIQYTLPVASAQVKSAILLASLYAAGETIITEPEPTRDHTEIMLRYLGADIEKKGDRIYSRPVERLHARPVIVPGDISSAAFWIVAAACFNPPGVALTIQNVGINETRTGILTALRAMGADIRVHHETERCGERVADLTIQAAPLTGTTVSGALIPRMIDEIPALAVAALYAKGRTVIRDAAELKVKESNRIHTVATELGKLGAHITETEDGLVIDGGYPLHGAVTDSHQDHRLAMSLAVAAIGAEGDTEIENSECVDISFPGFYQRLL